jgi:hypothetical protein
MVNRATPCCARPLPGPEGRCLHCGHDLRDLPAKPPAPKARLSDTARAEAQRILDGAARRTLTARLDGDAVGTTPRRDDDLGDRGPDECPPLVEGELVPVSRRDDDGGNGRGDQIG